MFCHILLYPHHAIMKIATKFAHNEMMPPQYTCDGEGRFPNLHVYDMPLGTKSLVLIVDDPDAP